MEKIKSLREVSEAITDIIEQLKILEEKLSIAKEDVEDLQYKFNTDYICD